MLFISSFANLLKQFLHGEKDDSRHLRSASDGVCFAASRGAVCEYGGIVAIQDTIQKVFRSALIDFHLRCIVIEYAIEGENLVLDFLAVGNYRSREFLDWVVLGGVKDSAQAMCVSCATTGFLSTA